MVTFYFLFTLLPKQSNRQGVARAVDPPARSFELARPGVAASTATAGTLSAFPKDCLSAVLVNSSAKIFRLSLECHPLDGVTGGGPLVTPLLIQY